jgi:hypothetical protein
VSNPHGHTCDEMKAFLRRQRSWHLPWWHLFPLQHPLRHILHHLQLWKIQCRRRLLVRNLPCPLLPWSKMLMWRRLGSFVVSSFPFLNVKTFSCVQPENFSHRVVILCKYIFLMKSCAAFLKCFFFLFFHFQLMHVDDPSTCGPAPISANTFNLRNPSPPSRCDQCAEYSSRISNFEVRLTSAKCQAQMAFDKASKTSALMKQVSILGDEVSS